MLRHEKTIYISSREINRINRLLKIKSLEELSDNKLRKLGANTNTCEGIYNVKFDNGSSLNFNLCSGIHNYYDEVIWTSANGKHDVFLDCEFELDDIEVEIENELYVVKVVAESK